jgi:hypothetical protein
MYTVTSSYLIYSNQVAASVLPARINPHGLGLSGAFKAKTLIEVDRTTIGREHELVKALVPLKKRFHHFSTDAFTLVIGMNQQVGEIDNQVAVRDGIAKAYEMARLAGSHQCVRVSKRQQQLLGLVG